MTVSTFQAAVAGGGKDTYFDSSAPTTNFGTADPLICGAQFGKLSRVLMPIIEFDISSIPATDRISAATLTLDVTAVVGARTWSLGQDPQNAVGFARIIRTDWVEAEATWNIYKAANNWSTAGALQQNADREGDNQTPPYDSSSRVWYHQMPQATGSFVFTFTQDGVAHVQRARTGSSGIYIIQMILQPSAGPNCTFNFSSDDDATLGNRPLLTVTHAAAATFIHPRRGRRWQTIRRGERKVIRYG